MSNNGDGNPAALANQNGPNPTPANQSGHQLYHGQNFQHASLNQPEHPPHQKNNDSISAASLDQHANVSLDCRASHNTPRHPHPPHSQQTQSQDGHETNLGSGHNYDQAQVGSNFGGGASIGPATARNFSYQPHLYPHHQAAHSTAKYKNK